MKEKEEILAWNNGLIVLDTSVLLDLYLYSKPTRQEIVKSYFDKFQKRLWIPKQVELEFDANRNSIIQKIRQKYDFLLKKVPQQKDSNAVGKIQQYLKDIEGQFQQINEAVKDNSKHPYFHPKIISLFSNKIDDFKEGFENFKKSINEEADKTISELEGGEEIVDIEKILKKYFQVGKGLRYKDKLEIIEEGEIRYRNGIPPGYEDAKSKDGFKQYGDLFIWKEILEKAKEVGIPIIFVTNDMKRDWWDNTDNKNRKPREELIQELLDYSDQKLFMYDTSDFLHKAGVFLNMTVSELILKEVEEVIEENRSLFSFEPGYDLMRFINRLYIFEFDTGNRIRGVLLPDYSGNKERYYIIPQEKLKSYKEKEAAGDLEAAMELRSYIDPRRIVSISG